MYLAHDDHVGTVLLQEGEGLPLTEVEPVGKHDVEAELRCHSVNITLYAPIQGQAPTPVPALIQRAC